jgi:hypothetical protein
MAICRLPRAQLERHGTIGHNLSGFGKVGCRRFVSFRYCDGGAFLSFSGGLTRHHPLQIFRLFDIQLKKLVMLIFTRYTHGSR